MTIKLSFRVVPFTNNHILIFFLNVIFKTGLSSKLKDKVEVDVNQSENDCETVKMVKTQGKTKYNIADLLKQVLIFSHKEIYQK